MMQGAAVIPDRVRQADTLKVPLPVLWPPLPLVISRFSVLSLMGTELWKSGLVTCWNNLVFTPLHTNSFLCWLEAASQLWRQAFYCFRFPFPWSHWHYQWAAPKPQPPCLPGDPSSRTVGALTDKQRKGRRLLHSFMFLEKARSV